MRREVFVFLVLIGMFLGSGFALSQEPSKIRVYFFYSPVCPHCAKENAFLDTVVKEKYPQAEIEKHNVFEKESKDFLVKLYKDYNVPSNQQGLVPITFVEKEYFLGFNEEVGKHIESHLLSLIEEKPQKKEPISKEKVRLPILGQVDLSNYSLPILAVILGFFDGFNVCSLGALVLILGLVLAFRSRKKVLILGSIFIFTTGLIYGILIFVWHQVFLALTPLIKEMKLVIGILGIGGGVYFLREFFRFKKEGPVCRFGGISENLSGRLQEAFERKAGILALAGAIFLFAAVITVVEFPCSAVLPVLFAGFLSEAKIPLLVALFYIVIYLFFYMLDEIVLFLVSAFTLKIWITSSRFLNILNLAAAIILFGLGLYYLVGIV